MKVTLHYPAGLEGRAFQVGNPSGMTAAHTHEELEFNLITSGRGVYLVDERKYQLAPHTLIWLHPGQPHILSSVEPDFRMWVVVFRPSLVNRACTSAFTEPLRKSLPSGDFTHRLTFAQARWLDRHLQELGEQELPPDTYNAGLAYILMRAWTAFAEAVETVQVEQLHPAVFKAAVLVGQDGGNLTLPALAKRVGLSQSHLSRLFREQLGESITDYRNRQRMERFQEVFGNGRQRTLEDAALEAGFGSYAQFYRECREQLGRTPASYRRQVQGM